MGWRSGRIRCLHTRFLHCFGATRPNRFEGPLDLRPRALAWRAQARRVLPDHPAVDGVPDECLRGKGNVRCVVPALSKCNVRTPPTGVNPNSSLSTFASTVLLACVVGSKLFHNRPSGRITRSRAMVAQPARDLRVQDRDQPHRRGSQAQESIACGPARWIAGRRLLALPHNFCRVLVIIMKCALYPRAAAQSACTIPPHASVLWWPFTHITGAASQRHRAALRSVRSFTGSGTPSPPARVLPPPQDLILAYPSNSVLHCEAARLLETLLTRRSESLRAHTLSAGALPARLLNAATTGTRTRSAVTRAR